MDSSQGPVGCGRDMQNRLAPSVLAARHSGFNAMFDDAAGAAAEDIKLCGTVCEGEESDGNVGA